MEKRNITELWYQSRLHITDDLDYAPIVLKVDNSIVATLGNFSATIGKAKSRKTFSLTALVAAALINKLILSFSATLPEAKRKILYFDTEQSAFHCKKVLKRIVELADMDLNHHPANLEFVCLRKFDPVTRLEIIEEAITNTSNLGLVLIDGIRDLVFDINSPKESTEITSKLMQWSEGYNLHIHTILHVNKTDDNARGHLGTEILNKAESVLQVIKDSSDPDVSIVKAVSIRDKDFEPFAFRIGEDDLPELDDNFSLNSGTSKAFDYLEISESVHRQALQMTFADSHLLSYGDLIQKLLEAYTAHGFQMGINKIKSLKRFCENKRMVIKQGKMYSFNAKFYY